MFRGDHNFAQMFALALYFSTGVQMQPLLSQKIQQTNHHSKANPLLNALN